MNPEISTNVENPAMSANLCIFKDICEDFNLVFIIIHCTFFNSEYANVRQFFQSQSSSFRVKYCVHYYHKYNFYLFNVKLILIIYVFFMDISGVIIAYPLASLTRVYHKCQYWHRTEWNYMWPPFFKYWNSTVNSSALGYLLY